MEREKRGGQGEALTANTVSFCPGSTGSAGPLPYHMDSNPQEQVKRTLIPYASPQGPCYSIQLLVAENRSGLSPLLARLWCSASSQMQISGSSGRRHSATAGSGSGHTLYVDCDQTLQGQKGARSSPDLLPPTWPNTPPPPPQKKTRRALTASCTQAVKNNVIPANQTCRDPKSLLT